MSVEARRGGRSGERSAEVVSIACCVVWATATLVARQVGLWWASGTAAIVLGALVLLLQRERVAEQLRVSPRLLGAGAAAGAAMIAATYLLYPLAGLIAPAVPSWTAELYDAFRRPPGNLSALLLPLVIVGEDFVWRGVVQDHATRRFGVHWGVVTGAAVYALAALPLGSPLLPLLALACGLYWSALRAWTGSLTPVLVSHLVWDTAILLVRPLA
jgi:membrane protease YdiL (CAAX protease family)